MRKVLIFLIVLAFLLVGCSWPDFIWQAPDSITEEWQTITITGIGSFRVPSEWNVEEEDRFLYFTDRPRADGDYTIYMVGTSGSIEFLLYELFEGVERGERLRGWIYNAGGTVGLSEFRVDGVKQAHHTISFSTGRHSYRLFGWNREVVDEWHADQIARTVRTARYNYDHPNAGRLELSP